jgi:hypothetical protein
MVLYMDDTVGAIVQGLRCPTETGRRVPTVPTEPGVLTVPGALSLTIDSHLRESRARPIPLASLRRERAMWETTLFVLLADNGGPICTLTALFVR